ncbi:MAG: DNA ligase (NAD(+)) LigA [Bacteroidetes bacterium GWF2_41_31]|nr:MAG: DNA ligase (NAD(+)) LigA [Bacteroidetes bacterium GWF2_41_31]
MIKEEAENRVRVLVQKLNQYNFEYYNLSSPTISDFEFDQLLKELETLEKEFPEFIRDDSPTLRVGGEPTKDFASVVHRYPMLSLSNTYSESEIREFDARVRKTVGETVEYVCELKFDGLSIGLTYENGVLKQAVTRGDGVQGDDVTNNVRTIKTIPLRLQKDAHGIFEIRGEIIMTLSGFRTLNADREEVGDAPFANPRNAAAGSIKMQDPIQVAQRPLDCFLYYLPGSLPYITTHYQGLRYAKTLGLKISDDTTICTSLTEIFDFINKWDTAREHLDYETDGIVIKVNSLTQQKQLGFTAKNPRWAIAFKFKTERVETPLLSIDYQVGRTGAITPVANLRPIQLGGTVVKRASLHNADIIQNLDVRLGDFVYVEKGGEIIPKIIGVNLEKRPPSATSVQFISHCPECGSLLRKNEGESAHFCPNEDHCPPQIKGKLEHFISRKAMNIDSLGEGKIELLWESGLVKDPADLYDLTYDQLFGLTKVIPAEGVKSEKKASFREKTAENIVHGVAQSKVIPFQKVLFALGIRFVGETVAKKLANHFQNIDNLQKARFDDLVAIEDIGERIADSVLTWFSRTEHIELIERLRKHGLQFESMNRLDVISEKLSGKTFVVSGVFNHFSREEIKQLIEKHGGKNLGSISSQTHYLIAGEKMGPAKKAKAEKLGIPIITEDQFEEMISSN